MQNIGRTNVIWFMKHVSRNKHISLSTESSTITTTTTTTTKKNTLKKGIKNNIQKEPPPKKKQKQTSVITSYGYIKVHVYKR